MARETQACRACGKPLVFLKTTRGTSMPVDADSVPADADYGLFEPGKHVSHFSTCPNADQFRKPRKSKRRN